MLDQQDIMDRPTTTQVTAWIALLCLAVLVSLSSYQSFQVGTYQDDASYVVLARSLITSDRYGMVNVPGEPKPGKYPFAYPLLLSVVMRLFPDNETALKLPSLIATGLNAALLFWGWRYLSQRKSYWWAVVLAGLYALSPITVSFTRMVMSEPIFTTFCLLSLILASQYAQGRQKRWWSAAMALALTLTVYTRSVGIVLVAVVLGYLLFVKGRAFWRQIALIMAQVMILLAAVVILTPVELRDLLPMEYLKDENARVLVAPFPDDSSNSGAPVTPPGDTGDITTVAVPTVNWDEKVRIMRDLLFWGVRQHLGSDIRAIALPIGGGVQEQMYADRMGIPWLPSALGYVVSALVIAGLLRGFVQEGPGPSLFLTFAALYLVALFLWIWMDPRLLYPIQPQIQFGFLLGLQAPFTWVRRRVGKTLTPPNLGRLANAASVANVAVVLALAVISTYKSLQIEDSRLHAGDLRMRTDWFRANTPASATIMTEAPEIDYLYSGRKAVSYPPLPIPPDQLDHYAQGRSIDYILIAPAIQWQAYYAPVYSPSTALLLPELERLVAARQARMVYARNADHVQVFQLMPGSATAEEVALWQRP
jgi:4-amino-4-deoxy-L-arabinose transferase-like glycosyltransferase